MSEVERIRKMAADGTITPEEADDLIALLEDLDQTGAHADAVASAVTGAGAPEEPSTEPPSTEPPPGPATGQASAQDVGPASEPAAGASHAQTDAAGDERTEPSAAGGGSGGGDDHASHAEGGRDPRWERAEARARRAAERAAAAAERAASKVAERAARRAAAATGNEGDERPGAGDGLRTPEGFAWFRIPTLAGDFDITVDASLDAPDVDGPDGVSVRETEHGYALDLERSSIFDRLVSGQLDRDFRIRLPRNVGVDLQISAGDVDLRDVPYLKGHILAGDIKAVGLRGIDLRISAGDVDVGLAPTDGEHRILMTAGDIDVRLASTSDVRIEGAVSIGDVSMPPGFEMRRRGVGETFRGTIGAGTAVLEIRQSTGDTKVSVDDE